MKKRAKEPGGVKPALTQPLLKPFDFNGWGYQMPELGVAEKQAQLNDEIAALHEKSGRADLATQERDRAAWWRKLADFPEDKAKRHYEDCERDARDDINALLARAEKFDTPLFQLTMLLRRLLDGLHAIAAHGNELAGRMLMNSVSDAVGAFEMLAHTKPELFRPWARGSFGIPAIISPSTEKTDKKKKTAGETPSDNQLLIDKLEVAADCHLAILPTGNRGKKWRAQDRANSLAIRLQSYIALHREFYDVHKLQAQEAGREIPGWLHEAKKLENFSAGVWKQWADLAWRVIAEISPDGKPRNHPAFYEPATKICNVRTESHDAIAEQDIKEALFGAFELIATGTSRRTKQRARRLPRQ